MLRYQWVCLLFVWRQWVAACSVSFFWLVLWLTLEQHVGNCALFLHFEPAYAAILCQHILFHLRGDIPSLFFGVLAWGVRLLFDFLWSAALLWLAIVSTTVYTTLHWKKSAVFLPTLYTLHCAVSHTAIHSRSVIEYFYFLSLFPFLCCLVLFRFICMCACLGFI